VGFVDFELRGKNDTMAFIDLGDQILPGRFLDFYRADS